LGSVESESSAASMLQWWKLHSANSCNKRQLVVLNVYVDGVRRCLWTAATSSPIVRPSDIRVWRTVVEWYWQGKTEENREKPIPSATLSTTNPTWTNPGHRGEVPATNRLNHGTALNVILPHVFLKSRPTDKTYYVGPCGDAVTTFSLFSIRISFFLFYILKCWSLLLSVLWSAGPETGIEILLHRQKAKVKLLLVLIKHRNMWMYGTREV
jgi:hypothetical protein